MVSSRVFGGTIRISDSSEYISVDVGWLAGSRVWLGSLLEHMGSADGGAYAKCDMHGEGDAMTDAKKRLKTGPNLLGSN